MSLRIRFSDDMKAAMRAADAPRLSTLRMIMARVKDLDIAARPKGIDRISDEEIVPALRAMVKSRIEAAVLYVQGDREELAAKERAEIAVIESYLPAGMNDADLATAIDAAIAQTGAAGVRDMGRVMAALKATHGASLDMARVNPLVKVRLG